MVAGKLLVENVVGGLYLWVSVDNVGSRQIYEASVDAREYLPVGLDTTYVSMVWPRQLGKVAEFRLESSRIVRCTEIRCFSSTDKSWLIQW